MNEQDQIKRGMTTTAILEVESAAAAGHPLESYQERWRPVLPAVVEAIKARTWDWHGSQFVRAVMEDANTKTAVEVVTGRTDLLATQVTPDQWQQVAERLQAERAPKNMQTTPDCRKCGWKPGRINEITFP